MPTVKNTPVFLDTNVLVYAHLQGSPRVLADYFERVTVMDV